MDANRAPVLFQLLIGTVLNEVAEKKLTLQPLKRYNKLLWKRNWPTIIIPSFRCE